VRRRCPGTEPIPFKFFVPGYFETMRTPIVEGQSFAQQEHVGSPSPVLVSAALARRLYPDHSAIGQPVYRLTADAGPPSADSGRVGFTIAGVVSDVRELSLRDAPTEIVYVPVIEPRVEQSIIPTEMSLVIRTRVPPLSMAAEVRRAIATTDPAVSVAAIRTMDAIVLAARGTEAFIGTLLLLAAVLSLFLGAVGIYGSVAQVVRHRTREIGIRMALGARRTEVVRMVLAGSMIAVVVGAMGGVILALLAVGALRALRALLFGVQARDPMLFVGVSVVLLTAALFAALLAASRAIGIEPVRAMRGE
jgi:hypothetical protein